MSSHPRLFAPRATTAELRARPTAALIVSLMASAVAAPATAQQADSSSHGRALSRALAAAQASFERGLVVWEDHSTWDKAWRVRSKFFEVRTTRGYGAATGLSRALDGMVPHFQQALATDWAPARPLRLWVFPTTAEYNAFGEENGEHHSSFFGSFHAAGHEEKPVAAVWGDNPLWLRIQLTHSAVHQYLDAAFPQKRLPTWVEEGLAAYFSFYWDYNWALGEFERLKAAAELPPLRVLLRDNINAYGQNTHARFVELGMLFYYLLRYREDTRTTLPHETTQRAPFRDYLNELLAGRDPDPDLPFAKILAAVPELEREFRQFEFPR